MKVVEKMNKKFVGRLLILVNTKDTHMMDGYLTLQYFEQLLTPAIRKRRLELNLPTTARAGLLADAFTGNEAAEYKLLRMRWADELNVEFINGVPGGWSKNGQPCDKFHALFRYLQDLFEAAALGHFSEVCFRKKLEEMLHGQKTTGAVKLTHEDTCPWPHTQHTYIYIYVYTHIPSNAEVVRMCMCIYIHAYSQVSRSNMLRTV